MKASAPHQRPGLASEASPQGHLQWKTTILRLPLTDPPRIAQLRWIIGPCGVAGPDKTADPDTMPDAITKKPRFSLRRAYVPRVEALLRLHPDEASLSRMHHTSPKHPDLHAHASEVRGDFLSSQSLRVRGSGCGIGTSHEQLVSIIRNSFAFASICAPLRPTAPKTYSRSLI